MQLAWLIRGLRTGVVTTRYPRQSERWPVGFRGRPVLDVTRCRAADGCAECVNACLPGAIVLDASPPGDDRPGRIGREARLALNYGACIMCGLCVTACPSGAMVMTEDDELAARRPDDLVFVADVMPSAGGLRHSIRGSARGLNRDPIDDPRGGLTGDSA